MKTKEQHIQQRQNIREFDTELFSYTGQIAWFVPGFFSFVALILASIPIQEFEGEDKFLLFISSMLMLWLSCFILLPYMRATETFTPYRKQNRTYDKLKYLPVSKKQYNIVRMEHLFRYIWKFAAAALILQCFFALLIVRKLALLNILYVIEMFFILPLFAGFLQIWVDNASFLWIALTCTERILSLVNPSETSPDK